MEHTDIKTMAAAGLIWQIVEKIGVYGFQFILHIILARFLEPKDVGVMAILTVFISISDLLVNSGMGTALIQKKEIDEMDLSTVFFSSLIIACFMYLIMFNIAPIVASFYKEPIIVPALRIYAISTIFFAINGVQKSILLRDMKYKKVFKVTIIPALLSGILGMIFAYLGKGIYSLIINALTFALFTTFASALTIKWKPKVIYSISRAKELLSFSYKLLLASLLETGFKSLYPLIIGKIFNSSILGYYNYGRQIPSLISTNINTSIVSVVFPIFSRSQSDRNKLKEMLRQTNSLSSFVIFPIIAGLAATSKSLVLVFLTEKWLPSVFYIQMFCIVFGLFHIQNINFQAISAMGRSEVFLKYEVIKKAISFTLLVITIPFGIKVLVVGQAIASILFIIINFKTNIKWMNYSNFEQVRDFVPSLLLSLFMFLVVWAIQFLGYGTLFTLLQVIVGFIIYIGLALLLNFETYKYLIDVTRNLVKNFR